MLLSIHLELLCYLIYLLLHRLVLLCYELEVFLGQVTRLAVNVKVEWLL